MAPSGLDKSSPYRGVGRGVVEARLAVPQSV